MKKCPFCAEDIQDEAIKCKHCRHDLSHVQSKTKQSNPFTKEKNKKVLKWIGIGFLVIIAIAVWYISIPAVIIWYIWKKTKLNRKNKIIVTALCTIVSLVVFGYLQYLNRVPTLTITAPVNNSSVQSQTIKLVGSVRPKESLIKINNTKIQVNNGSFEYEAQLSEEKNEFVILAINSRVERNSTSQKIAVNRIFTAEELVERERLQAEVEAKKQAAIEVQKKAEEDRKTKELEEQKEWDQSKAGRLCKKYPTWTKDECLGVADGKYWVGMNYYMLITVMGGKPSSANPSNYGGKTHWQWCWYGYTPSCFYDDNDDGIIESYN